MRFLCLLFVLLLPTVHAQSYPTKPVRVIVAFSPGGVTDIVARTVMPKLAELWHQPVVVENRAGAGGSVGALVVKSAPADGSVLLVHSSGYAINAAINPALPYDPYKDFVAVAHLGSQPQVLVVNPASGYRSVRDLIAAARRSRARLPTARRASAAAATSTPSCSASPRASKCFTFPTRAASTPSTTPRPGA